MAHIFGVEQCPARRPLRLPRIIELLRIQPLPAEVMLPQLNLALRTASIPEVSIRTLQHDLEWLLENLGEAGIERVARAELKPAPPLEFHRYRIFYRLIGAEDLIPITADLVFLSEMEALALMAARALLATPATPGVKDTTGGETVRRKDLEAEFAVSDKTLKRDLTAMKAKGLALPQGNGNDHIWMAGLALKVKDLCT